MTAEILVNRVGQVYSLPVVYMRLTQLIDDPYCDLEDVAKVISEDAGICVRLLKIANSSMYNFPSKIETITRALTVIGTKQLRDLVLATCVIDMFKDIPDEQLSEFAKYSKEETINKKDTLTIDKQNKSELHIPLVGEIVNLDTGEIVEPGTIISSMNNTNTDDLLMLLAKEKTFLLKTNMYLLNNLLINNIKFAEKYIESI